MENGRDDKRRTVLGIEMDGKQDKLIVNPTKTTATLTGLGIDGVNYKIEGGSGSEGIQDVKVDGVSVVTDKIANIDLATPLATKQDKLPDGENNTYLHKNIETGNLEWAEVQDSCWSKGEGANSAQLIADTPEYQSKALGEFTVAEGIATHANGRGSHTEGENTNTIADYSHAEGSGTTTNGANSHAEGKDTITNNFAEHAEGKFNISHADSDSPEGNGTISSIGIGEYSVTMDKKKNAFEVLKDGATYLINIGNYDGINPFGNSVKSVQTIINNKQNRLNPEKGLIIDSYNNIKVDPEVYATVEYTMSSVDQLANWTQARLDEKQSINDASLKTTAKIIVGAINENKDNIDNVREVAAGKTKTYVISIASNPAFNSQETTITATGIITTDGQTIPSTDLKKGDNILLIDTGVPDRWYAAENIFSKLETSKVDLTAYQTRHDNALETASQEIVGAINELHEKSIVGVSWGSIQGQLKDQTDLQTTLNTKVNTLSNNKKAEIFNRDGGAGISYHTDDNKIRSFVNVSDGTDLEGSTITLYTYDRTTQDLTALKLSPSDGITYVTNDKESHERKVYRIATEKDIIDIESLLPKVIRM